MNIIIKSKQKEYHIIILDDFHIFKISFNKTHFNIHNSRVIYNIFNVATFITYYELLRRVIRNRNQLGYLKLNFQSDLTGSYKI